MRYLVKLVARIAFLVSHIKNALKNWKLVILNDIKIKFEVFIGRAIKSALRLYEMGKMIDGGVKRDRTADLLNAIQALSQLSYNPKRFHNFTLFYLQKF